MDVHFGFVEINGAQIYFEEAGPANTSALPMIMVHAGVADRRMWDDQFSFFAQQRRTIRYDLRGYGRTKMVAGKYSHYEDLYGVMRHFNLERAILMGCSIGGGTIVDFAVLHPEMAAALVTVCAWVNGYEPQGRPPQYQQELGEALKKRRLEEAVEYAARIWVDGHGRKPDQTNPVVREKLKEMAKIAFSTPDGVGKMVELSPPAIQRLDALQMPLLAVVGDLDDRNIMIIADELVATVPVSKKVVLTDTAHFPNMERPEDFNRVVSAFFEGLGI